MKSERRARETSRAIHGVTNKPAGDLSGYPVETLEAMIIAPGSASGPMESCRSGLVTEEKKYKASGTQYRSGLGIR